MTQKNKATFLITAFAATLSSLVLYTWRTPEPNARTATLGVAIYSPPEQTKTEGCLGSEGLQDKACTPGAIVSSANKAAICKSGYAKSVRNVPESEKSAVY